MGKVGQRMVRISQEELRQLCEDAAQKGAEVFRNLQDKEKKKREKENDKVAVTKKRLREYRAVKAKISEREISEEEIPELRFEALRDLMGEITSSDSRTENKIRSRLNKQLSDTLELKSLEKAFNEYEEGCRMYGTKEDVRRCNVIYKMYLSDTPYTAEEIAEMENITERTVYRDVSLGVVQLSSYLLGF